ncbi:MAG: nucleotide exchange factor GrpE [Bacteriovoracaceae bacterium]
MDQNENKTNPENEEKKAEAETQTPKEEPKKDEVDYKAKYFYLAAEMENARKRMERERENDLKYGNQKILENLIQVIDNFDRTLDMLKGDQDSKVQNIVTGLRMVEKQFVDTLGKYGLSQIESVGKDFDPNYHEALAQEYVEGKRPNEVIKEFQKGYVLNGRVVRAAKVVVASDKQ